MESIVRSGFIRFRRLDLKPFSALAAHRLRRRHYSRRCGVDVLSCYTYGVATVREAGMTWRAAQDNGRYPRAMREYDEDRELMGYVWRNYRQIMRPHECVATDEQVRDALPPDLREEYWEHAIESRRVI